MLSKYTIGAIASKNARESWPVFNIISLARLSEVSGAKVEVNLFHRTPERVEGLTNMMNKVGIDALGKNADDNWFVFKYVFFLFL